MVVGVISDTHGLLRPEAVALLKTCDRIIHAGDVGNADVLAELQSSAPTFAVRGNVDRGKWADALPLALHVTWNGVAIHVLHDLNDLTADPLVADVRIVISGHSHKARFEEKDGVIYLNPGSIGPRRFKLPVTMAWLHFSGDGAVEVEPVTLLE